MCAFRCTTFCPRPAGGISAFLLLSAFAIFPAPQPVHAQGTHLWNQSQMEEFEKGTPQGVAITSDGHLHQGPDLTGVLTTPSTFVWSVAVDKKGVAYAATGSPATVLRVGSDKKAFPLFKSKDLTVQVVRLGPDGSLYAATLPSGKVYKLNPDAATAQDDSSATVVFDAEKAEAGAASKQDGAGKSGEEKAASAKSHYIWDLSFDPQGRLYIATGDPGAIYRVDPSHPNAQPEEFFKSDEAHIRTLAWDKQGNLLAGSDGSGLVYRISPQGKGYVLFDAPQREITSLAVAADGTIYAACVGDKSHNPLPPLAVQSGATITITVVQPGSLQAANASSSLPEGSQIFAIREDQAPRKLWADKDDVVYALAAQPDGLLALTGNRGHLFHIAADGSYADVGHLSAQQGLSLAAEPGSHNFLIGTGNTGKLVTLGDSATHQYASDVLDASAFARFGRVEVEPGSSGYQIFTRTGNIDQPARGWTDWQPLHDDQVASPPGRFLQWKVELQPGGSVGSVGVNYLPANTAPVVDNMVVVPGARLNPQPQINQQTVNIAFPASGQSGITFDATSSSSPLQATKDPAAITVRWAAHDDDGDKLSYDLYVRGDSENVWRLLKARIKEEAYSFDATRIPDGGYRIRVVASDAPSESPGAALTGDKVSDRFVIDTTPPVVSALKAAPAAANCSGANCAQMLNVTFDADDATSPIARAQYSIDFGPWQYLEPVGKLSDSRHEHYEFHIPAPPDKDKPAEHLITVRVYDRYENAGLGKTIVPAGAK